MPGPDIPRSSPWSVYMMLSADGANITWTNQPSGETFFGNSHRHVQPISLWGLTYGRLIMNKQGTAANTGATVELRYSTTYQTVAGNYVQLGVTPIIVSIDVTNQVVDSGWIELNNDAKGDEDVFLALVGVGGNGTIDPQFGSVSARFQ